MVFAALVMIRAEIIWFFSHVGVTVGKSKGARVMPIEMVLILTSSYIVFFLYRHVVFRVDDYVVGAVPACHIRSPWINIF